MAGVRNAAGKELNEKDARVAFAFTRKIYDLVKAEAGLVVRGSREARGFAGIADTLKGVREANASR